MRQQGKIVKWLDDKGFGFVSAEGSSEQVFVHISAFPKGLSRPTVGEVISFEVVNDVKKGLQATHVLYLNRVHQSQPKFKSKKINKQKNYTVFFLVLVASICCLLSYQFYIKVSRVDTPLPDVSGFVSSIEAAKEEKSMDFRTKQRTINTAKAISVFQCSGKRRCNEMASCEEAKFYLNNCPGTIADGDGDGIPCEDQWCGH